MDPQNLPVRVCNHPFWVVANTFSPLSHTQIYTLYIYVCIYTYKANVLLCRPLVTFVAAFYEFLTSATSIHIYIHNTHLHIYIYIDVLYLYTYTHTHKCVCVCICI